MSKDQQPHREQEIFEEAMEIASPEEREAFLIIYCAGKPDLRARVDALLAAYEAAPEFLSDNANTKAAVIQQPGDRIGRYKLLETIGEGGFGVVWMAEQEEPVRRRVALKIIKAGMDTRQVVLRFEAERQALAMMEHPGIARVFDGGVTDTGRPYFVMELVRGVRITDYCDARQLEARERLALFIEVCAAVQHAHQKGIIHRDLKPSNILVTEENGRPMPKVIDFGVAKATQQPLSEQTLFTSFNQILGTPAYMSPEQAGLGGLNVDTRSDVYSLGVLLYELLTGYTPFTREEFQKAGLDGVMRLIREQDPPRPSTRLSSLTREELLAVATRRHSDPAKLNKLLRGELDWVSMKALEKSASRRYQSATAFAEDVQRFLKNEPVMAAAPSPVYRMKKFARRHRAGLAAAVTFLVLLIAATVVSVRFAVVANSERGKAHDAQVAEGIQRHAAETSAAESLERLIRIDVANGVQAMESGDWFGALLWFTEALRQDRPGTRAEEMHRYRIGSLLNYAPRLTQAWFHEKAINDGVFSPDGRWVVTSSQDHTARLWDVVTGQPGPVLPHATNVLRSMFSATGGRVLTLSGDGIVRVWNPTNGQMIGPPLEHGYRVTHAVLSKDGSRVFTLGNSSETNFTADLSFDLPNTGEVRIWDAMTGRQVRPAFRHNHRIAALALSADSEWLAVNVGDSVVTWNLRESHAVELTSGDKDTNRLLRTVIGKPGAVSEMLLPEIPRARRTRAGEERLNVNCFAFSPDGQRIAVGYGDGSSRVWALRKGAPLLLQQPKSRGAVDRQSYERSICFSPDGRRILALNEGGTARLWNAITGESEGQLKTRAGEQAWFSPDSRFVFLGGVTQVWDVETDEPVTPKLPQIWMPQQGASFSPEGSMILTTGADGVARLWNLASSLPSQPPFKHDWSIISAQRAASGVGKPLNFREQFDQALLTFDVGYSRNAFSADGTRVVTVGWNGSARVWDAKSGAPVTPYVIMDSPLVFGAFNRNGTRFVTAGGSPPDSEFGVARVWDARTGQPSTPVIRHPEQFASAAFSADDRWLITQGYKSAQLWDAHTGERAKLPMTVDQSLRCAMFTADGKFLALCVNARKPSTNGAPTSATWQTEVWNLSSGSRVAVLAETNEVSRMEFSPDGHWLLMFVTTDTKFFYSARIWNVLTGQPLTRSFSAHGFPKMAFTEEGHLFMTHLSGETVGVKFPDGTFLNTPDWRGFKLDPETITADGRRVAARGKDGWQVFDTITAEPLTPPLEKLSGQTRGDTLFSPNGRALLVPGKERAQLWPLPRDDRPAEELVILAQLLSARRLDGSGYSVAWKSGEAGPAWRALQSRYPQSFSVAPEHVRRWRESIVEYSEKQRNWSTAAFHLEQLARSDSDNGEWRTRLAYARNQLALEELKQ